MKRIKRREFIRYFGKSAIGSALSYNFFKENISFAQSSSITSSPYIIIVHCDGGWDPTLVFDNKIASNYVETQPGIQAISGPGKLEYIDHPDRPLTKYFFQNHGLKTAIVNGLYCGSFSHSEALIKSSGSFLTTTNRFADWLTFYGSQAGGSYPVPHISIDAHSIPGTLGEASARITSETIEKARVNITNNSTIFSSKNDGALSDYLDEKYKVLLDNRITQSLDSEKLQALQSSYVFTQTINKSIIETSFDNSKSQFENNIALAVNFLEKGYSKCATVQAGVNKQWDTHSNNDQIQSENYEMLFSALSNLIENTQSNSSTSLLKDNLTIIVKSELGRSPIYQTNSPQGKGHWPFTSALLWGKGINGGKVFGKTDDFLRGVPINPIFGTTEAADTNPLEISNIFAGLFELFEIPHSSFLTDDIIPASILLSK
ncbi:MAG: DUF1501 domain-containing protein [Bdellovibrionota bacterium]